MSYYITPKSNKELKENKNATLELYSKHSEGYIPSMVKIVPVVKINVDIDGKKKEFAFEYNEKTTQNGSRLSIGYPLTHRVTKDEWVSGMNYRNLRYKSLQALHAMLWDTFNIELDLADISMINNVTDELIFCEGYNVIVITINLPDKGVLTNMVKNVPWLFSKEIAKMNITGDTHRILKHIALV